MSDPIELTRANNRMIASVAAHYGLSRTEAVNFCLAFSSYLMPGSTVANARPEDHHTVISQHQPGVREYRAACTCGDYSQDYDTYAGACLYAYQHLTDVGAA